MEQNEQTRLVLTVAKRHLFQQRAPLSVQDSPPRRSTLLPSPKLLGYASATFAQRKMGERREAHLNRLLS
jgi:hypothetical protein